MKQPDKKPVAPRVSRAAGDAALRNTTAPRAAGDAVPDAEVAV